MDVDTAELDEKYGEAASYFLKNLLVGETVWVERYGEGQRGRPLVCLFRVPDGLFVDLEIIRQGYGEVHIEGNFDRKQLFLDYQEFAQKAKKGVWAEKDGIEGEYVYIASSGRGKSHHRTPECQYIRDRNVGISLEEAKRRGLKPCKRCEPPE